MKKLVAAFLLLTLLVYTPTNSFSAEIKSYPNEVHVKVNSTSGATVTLLAPYQLYNIATKQSTILPENTAVKFEKKAANIVVSYSGLTESSSAGFKLQELFETEKLVVFTASTSMRRGATTSYEVVKTFKAGESAAYLSSFTNAANELWYRVTSGSYTGWVPAANAKLTDAAKTSLAKINNGITYRGSFDIIPNGTNVDVINILDMEDYLKGVVPREMPSSWHMEALKAQAIVARSYAEKVETLSNTTASQVYGGYSAETARTNEAVEATKGLVVRYKGNVIQTYFHSTSGGRTANVWDVWNSSQATYPYLASVEDEYESSPTYSNWQETFTPSVILSSFGFNNTVKLFDISLQKTGMNGEVSGVTVKTSAGDKTITGNENTIRNLFPIQNSSNYNILYSNWFTMQVQKSASALSAQTTNGVIPMSKIDGQAVQTANGQITLSGSQAKVQTANGIITQGAGSGEVTSITLNGKGWGHRIGLSQYGAKGYAEHGWKAEDIVKHYFTGVTVSK